MKKLKKKKKLHPVHKCGASLQNLAVNQYDWGGGSARLAHSDGVNGEFLLNTQLVNMHYKMPLVGLTESWREADK